MRCTKKLNESFTQYFLKKKKKKYILKITENQKMESVQSLKLTWPYIDWPPMCFCCVFCAETNAEVQQYVSWSGETEWTGLQTPSQRLWDQTHAEPQQKLVRHLSSDHWEVQVSSSSLERVLPSQNPFLTL